jgi:uncharacterized protein YraI
MRRIGYVLLLFAMVAGSSSPALLRPAPAAAQTTATATDDLNLRSGPTLSGTVLTVIPKGGTVTLTGGESNGFSPVSYNGVSGWAFTTYLAIDAPPASPNGTAVVTEALNLRSGSDLSYRVLVVMPAGAVVTLTGQQANGFLSLTYGGYSGWAHRDYLRVEAVPAPAPPPVPAPAPTPTGTAVTTDALNLRGGAGTSFPVITVMPVGTRVVLTGQVANGFHAVSLDGRNGWAASEFLAVDGTAPAPQVLASVNDDLNLRSGPATSYGVLAVMPRGAQVALTGQVNNGFHSVDYNGISGWAFSTYLDLPAAPAPPPQPPAEFAGTNAIVGPARGHADLVIGFAQRAGARRMDEVERYIREVYRLAPQIGFDPAIIVSQSALETGYWKSDWWVARLNPAGLGITGTPWQESNSPIFPNGAAAARAQLAHMHAEVFGNSRGLPVELQGADPTYQRVFEAGWAGTIRTVQDLSGTWAVDKQYHDKIVRVAREIYL